MSTTTYLCTWILPLCGSVFMIDVVDAAVGLYSPLPARWQCTQSFFPGNDTPATATGAACTCTHPDPWIKEKLPMPRSAGIL